MKAPKQPRYEYVIGKAIDYIIEKNICSLPVDAEEIIHESGWTLRTYTEQIRRLGTTYQDFCRAVGSESAFSVFKDGKLRIIVNDRERISARLEWSLMHEIGHYELGHYEQFDIMSLNESERAILDREADCWVSNVKAPVPIVDLMNCPAVTGNNRIFGLSKAAWRVRLNTMDKARPFIDPVKAEKIQLQFSSFLHRYECRDCGIMFITDEHPHSCPMCGSGNIKWKAQDTVDRFSKKLKARRIRHLEVLFPVGDGLTEYDREVLGLGKTEEPDYPEASLENPMANDALWDDILGTKAERRRGKNNVGNNRRMPRVLYAKEPVQHNGSC